MTTAGFGADVYLFLIVGLVFWLLLPTLMLGWSPVLIASGSMSPAIRPGDIVLINDTVTDEPLGAGTIITYTDPREGRDRLVTHRIAETALTPEADTVAEYITRGDANTVDDASPVPHDQVVGSARLLIPLLGLPVHWARTADHTSLSIFALLTLTAITVASDTARRTAVSVRPSRQQLRRNSRFAQRERAVVAARASRAAEAARAAGVAAMAAQAQLARHHGAGQAGLRPTADGGMPNVMPPGLDVPVASIQASPATDAAPPVQRGAGAASVAGAGGTDADGSTAGRAAPSGPSNLDGDEPHKPRLTPVAVLREPPRRARKRRPSRLFMLILLIGLTAGGAAIPGTGAAFTAVATSTGNMFATAAPGPVDDDPVAEPEPVGDLILSPEAGGGGAGTVDAGDTPPGQYQTYTFVFSGNDTVDIELVGEAVAQLSLRRNGPGNSPGDAVVRLLDDGVQIAAGNSGNVTNGEFALITFTLDGPLVGTYDPNRLTVEVDLRRLEMDLTGERSRIILPHAL